MNFIKQTILLITILITVVSCAERPVALFNGKDLSGWSMDVPKLDSVPDAQKPFIVRDGKLVSLGVPNGHLLTDNTYKNYRLEFEYRFVGETR